MKRTVDLVEIALLRRWLEAREADADVTGSSIRHRDKNF